MSGTLYVYAPLVGTDTIRILTLSPGQSTDPLVGTLTVVPIDSAGSYEALSYVWADPGPPDAKCVMSIRQSDGLKGELHLKSGSIVAALQHVRYRDKRRRIWADQCCINQDDLLERSQQVQFMNKIYRNASHILVWLGLDPDQEAESAFTLMHELDAILRNPLENGSDHRATVTALEMQVTSNFKSLEALTDRAWVSGLWVTLAATKPFADVLLSSNAAG